MGFPVMSQECRLPRPNYVFVLDNCVNIHASAANLITCGNVGCDSATWLQPMIILMPAGNVTLNSFSVISTNTARTGGKVYLHYQRIFAMIIKSLRFRARS